MIDYFKNKDGLKEMVLALPLIFTNSIIVGELFVAVYHGMNEERETKFLTAYMESVDNQFEIDSQTAAFYGQIHANLLKKGRPIPTNDIWIAASAKQHGLTVITNDKHFAEVEDLKVEFW